MVVGFVTADEAKHIVQVARVVDQTLEDAAELVDLLVAGAAMLRMVFALNPAVPATAYGSESTGYGRCTLDRDVEGKPANAAAFFSVRRLRPHGLARDPAPLHGSRLAPRPQSAHRNDGAAPGSQHRGDWS